MVRAPHSRRRARRARAARGPSRPGRLDAANAATCSRLLDRAIAGCLDGELDAMVTAPVQKSVINDAGIAFTGHTEYLAERTDTAARGDDAGRHAPLAAARRPRDHASAAVARLPRPSRGTAWRSALRILDADLRNNFGIAQPAHPRRRAQPARAARAATSAARKSIRHRPGDRAARVAGHRRARSAARRHVFVPRDRWTPTRCWRCTTTRACRC